MVALIGCIALPAWCEGDFSDDTFGIFSNDEQQALERMDEAPEGEKAGAPSGSVRQPTTDGRKETESNRRARERQRLLNARGDVIIYVDFSYLFDFPASRMTFKIRRIQDIFGKATYDEERTASAGSGFFNLLSEGMFMGLKYGLYEVRVDAYQERLERSASFTAKIWVKAKDNSYKMTVYSDSVTVNRW